MAAIEAEIDANDGVYPHNSGRLSQAELCRRANVSQKTLQNPSHRLTTLVEVNAWLKRVRRRMLVGRRSVRRAVTEQVDHWKDEYKKIATHYNVSRLEVADLEVKLQAKDAELVRAGTRIAALEAEIRGLRQDLSDGKVIRMPTKPKPGKAR
jgi:hypothetical protein